jgi:histidinol-phosphate aminotransferase
MSSKLKLSSPRILEINPYVPGAYAKPSGDKKLVKLASNENPLGCSTSVIMAINKELSKLNRYPDGASVEIRNKIGQVNGLDPRRIICGAGSDELISFICDAFGGNDSEVIYTRHGFLMYPIAALASGSRPVVAEEKDLRADVDAILARVNDNTRIIFLANPNNPTGSYINDKELLRLAKGLPKHVLLVLDMAYAEYVTTVDYPDPVKLIDEFDNIIMLRTFSKAYGIPALRLGWGYSNEYVIDVLNRVRGPFNVSSLAQVAGIAALSDQDFVKRSVQHNLKWLNVLQEAIEDMGFRVYPSVANFLLVDFATEQNAKKINDALNAEGISGRMMQAYHLPSCIRFTVGLEDECRILLETLDKFKETGTDDTGLL